MKNRIMAFLMAVVMLSGIFAVGSTAAEVSPYKDVKTSRWSYDDIMYVTEMGLMNGKSEGKFAPAETMTRAMVVTVLYRLQGEPETDGSTKFTDVKPSAWYGDAVNWAATKEIVNGVGNSRFAPMDTITREQLAAIIQRYAPMEHIIPEESADITGYADYRRVHDYAKEALSWANAVGLITGKTEDTLAPREGATREQFAAILRRFKEYDGYKYSLAYNAPVYGQNYTEPEYPLVTDADIYVAVDGNDANDGTFDKPIATFARAKEMVRELKAEKTAGEIKVAFKAGKYGELDNLTFTADDAGTAECPITYCAYGDGDVIFSNGIIINEDEFVPITDEEKKLFPERSADQIKKLDLHGLLPGELQISNYLFSEVDGIIWLARNLNKNELGQDIYYTNMVGEAPDRMKGIKLTGPLLKVVSKFSTVEGLMVKGMLRCGYLFDRFDVKSYDPATGVMEMDIDKYVNLMPDMPEGDFAYHGGFAYEGRMTSKIFFYNLAEFLDAQGEYWVDRESDVLYIYNPRGRYTFCTGGTLMTLEEGADHLSFIGLEFNGSSDTMIYSNADHTTYKSCTFANVGGHYAVRADGVNHFVFEDCDSHNFVDGSLYLISDADIVNVVPAGNVIRNNRFYDFGLSEYWSNAVRINHDVGGIIEHNEFKNGGHGGLRYDTCIDLMIQYNVFDTMMMTTEDYGALYTIGSTIYRDNTVRYNLFMNITGTESHGGAASYGFYVDDYSCGQYIYGNVFYNGGAHAVTLHDGRDNLVKENVIINTVDHMGGDFLMYTEGVYACIKNDNLEGYENTKFARYLKNIPQPGEEGYELWNSRWPILYKYHTDLSRLDETECAFRVENTILDNLIFGCTFDPGETYELFAITEGNMEYSLEENPCFTDPTHGDYSFTEESGLPDNHFDMMGRYR